MAKISPVDTRARGIFLIALVVILILGLPLAVWLDLRSLTEAALRRQASDLNSVITSVRGYYATNVVGRVLSAPGTAPRSPTTIRPFRAQSRSRRRCRSSSAT